MPIYEYQCQAPKCGRTFEVMQKMSDDPIDTCPACQGKNVKKLMSATSFVLKGSGWYQTDIARKEKAKHGEKVSDDQPKACPTPDVCGTTTCAN